MVAEQWLRNYGSWVACRNGSDHCWELRDWLWEGARSEDWRSQLSHQEGEVNENWKSKAERDAGHKFKDKDMRKLEPQEGSASGAQPGGSPGASPGESPGESPGGSPGASPGELPGESPGVSPGRSRGATKNEKRLSGLQATKNKNEILEPEMPEILKIDFLEEKLILESFSWVLVLPQQQRQKSRMKGGSSFASKYQAGPSVEEKCPTAKEGFGNIFYYDEGLENGTVTVISILLGKPFDVSTDFCLQYQFHSESITNNENFGACKRVGPKVEIGRSFQSQELGSSRGRRIRKPVRITVWVRHQAHWPSLAIWSLNSTTPKKSSWAGRCSTPRTRTSIGVRVLEYGSKNALIYNLDVSLISDFLDSLMTESMIVAALGTAETGGRRPIWWTRVVFELYGVNHTVTELEKRSRVWWSSPFLGSRWTWKSPFLVRLCLGGAQTIENEEYEETIKDVEECVACKAIVNQHVHARQRL